MIPPSSTWDLPDPPLKPPVWSADSTSPRLGRFVIGPELGRGGMGVVHLAWDPLLQRQLALKQLLHADPMLVLRFMREAQIQARVEHPRICKVFEISSEGGQPFIAMQYIQGQTLGEAREDLGLQEKAHIMAEVAGALHSAHRVGLVHRDIKPSNIMLEAQKEGGWIPFILDFGLARDQSSADLTLSWGFVGTPAFMSPEQAEGNALTPASDIYSLGATFYALFGGHPPFEATTLAGLIHQQDTQIIRSLRRSIPGFPVDLDTILLKCMDPEPSRRYASAFELEEDLRRWLAGEPIRARALGPVGRAWRKVKRHRTLSLALAGSLGMALLLVTWNIHAGRLARTRVALVQRFGLQIREVEQLLRIERMLPAHDIRPAEAQVRQRMAEIQSTMAKLGSVSQGPGHFALGRGHLVLGEFPASQKELEEALHCGFREPAVFYSLGNALLEQYIAASTSGSQHSPSDLEALRERLVLPALARFHQALGHVQENPAYGEAQVAYLDQDFTRCIQKCREAFQARPWMYEAKLLEARAWMVLSGQSLGLGAGPLQSQEEGLKDLDASGQALDKALRIAPSDERIYALELSRINQISVFQSDSGTPTEALFKRTDRIFSEALQVRPGSLDLLEAWFYARVREGFVLLRTGRDVRPLMQDSLRAARPYAKEMRATGHGPVLGLVHWVLADGRWRRGEEPLTDLAAMEPWTRVDQYDLAQPLALKGEFLASRGRDPSATLGRAEHILEAVSVQRDRDFYHHVIWGHVLLARADWQMDTGVDPMPVLDRGIAHLEQSSRINPRAEYPYFMLTQFHARRALACMSRGQDPDPDLQRAFAAGRLGYQVTRSHFRLFLALAEAHYARAIARISRKIDPDPDLREARAALAAGLRINPTDFHLHRQRALVELLAARHTFSQGHSPLNEISRAEAAAKRGLEIKADDPRLWLLLARAQRFRAEWAMNQKQNPEPWMTDGQKDLARALTINPTLPDSRAERTCLELLRGADEATARERLRVCLKQNPLLALEFPRSRLDSVVAKSRQDASPRSISPAQE